MNQEKKDPTIRGDKLLLVFQCIENCYASLVADPTGNNVPAPYIWFSVLHAWIGHPYRSGYWYGQIALCAPTRATLARTMDDASRRQAHFDINAVVSKAVSAASNRTITHGLSRNDRRKLRDCLIRLLCLVACGEINEQTLLSR